MALLQKDKGQTLSQYDTNVQFCTLDHKIIFTVKEMEIVFKYSSRFLLSLKDEPFLVPSLLGGDKTLLNDYMHSHYMTKWFPRKTFLGERKAVDGGGRV